MQCRECLILKLSIKLLAKNPLQSVVVRNASCFSPLHMVRDEREVSKSKLKRLLNYMVDVGRIEEKKCDDIIHQFMDFIDSDALLNVSHFQNFDPHKERLDMFLAGYMSESEKYCDLWQVAKLILILSHGQVSVERVFSVNKQLTVENKKENTYSAQRLVYDAVKQADGAKHVHIGKKMIQYCKAARQSYLQSLEKEKEEKKKSDRASLKRKNVQELTREKKDCVWTFKSLMHPVMKWLKKLNLPQTENML